MLIPVLTPDLPKVGPEHQVSHQTPHVVLHSRNFENSWILNWNGGQEVGRKEKEKKRKFPVTKRKKNQMKSHERPFSTTRQMLYWAHFKGATELALKNTPVLTGKQFSNTMPLGYGLPSGCIMVTVPRKQHVLKSHLWFWGGWAASHSQPRTPLCSHHPECGEEQNG